MNAFIEEAAAHVGIPIQRDVVGRDTGTDAMAGVLGNVDVAATSIGFPIRNMHTISECAHTGDVLAALHAAYHTVNLLDSYGIDKAHFQATHPRLDEAVSMSSCDLAGIAADGMGQGKKEVE